MIQSAFAIIQGLHQHILNWHLFSEVDLGGEHHYQVLFVGGSEFQPLLKKPDEGSTQARPALCIHALHLWHFDMNLLHPPPSGLWKTRHTIPHQLLLTPSTVWPV